MPFKSKAQMRKFGSMVEKGEISKSTFEHWAKATKGKKLPEKVKPKKKTK